MKNLLLIIIALSLLGSSCKSEKEPWIDLVNGSLDSWEQLNGSAGYKLVDGAIVGSTVIASPNSFLCTKEHFSDFILEFDVLVDPVMNSGVQIRSNSSPDYSNGSVYGYQVELDPSDRAWTAGIYDESRRMWLYPLDRNPAGKKAFLNNEWNHIRVEAIGNSLMTWCNGIACADLVDDMTPSGFIGLQVHGIGSDSTRLGKEVIWKNIRIITEDVSAYVTPYEPVIPQNSYLVNELTGQEFENGWKLLWDGETGTGWRSLSGDTFPESGWVIENGELRIEGEGGSIVTTEKYSNFELIVDFKYSEGGNSGIKYFIDGDIESGTGYNLGCEYQILDGRSNPDRIILSHTIGGLYDIIEPISPRDNGAGMWNRARIVVKGNSVEHWLNNQMTVKYERGTDEWREMVANSKFKGVEGFGEAESGRILLQDHNTVVSFRSIKIKEL